MVRVRIRVRFGVRFRVRVRLGHSRVLVRCASGLDPQIHLKLAQYNILGVLKQ